MINGKSQMENATDLLTIKTLRATRLNSRDPQGRIWLTAALVTSATVFLLKPNETYELT
jgi:hypothetical protein